MGSRRLWGNLVHGQVSETVEKGRQSFGEIWAKDDDSEFDDRLFSKDAIKLFGLMERDVIEKEYTIKGITKFCICK